MLKYAKEKCHDVCDLFSNGSAKEKRESKYGKKMLLNPWSKTTSMFIIPFFQFFFQFDILENKKLEEKCNPVTRM